MIILKQSDSETKRKQKKRKHKGKIKRKQRKEIKAVKSLINPLMMYGLRWAYAIELRFSLFFFL